MTNQTSTFSSVKIQSVESHLQGKLDGSVVREREQSGRRFSYVEGWYVIQEANLLFGFDGWTQELVDLKCVYEKEQLDQTKRGPIDRWHVSYLAKCRINVDGIIREDVGSGHGIDKDCGLAHESAAKEAVTDAMKRAFRTFGNKFGLALYDKDQANVATNKFDLICSDSTEFTRYILDSIESGKLTEIGKDTLLIIAKAKSTKDIKEALRPRVLEIINDKKLLSLVNEGKNPKDKTQVIDPKTPPEESAEDIEKQVNEAFGES